MSDNELLNPDIYNLNNGKAILLYSELLIETSNALNSREAISNGDVNIDCLERDQNVQAETGMNITKFNSIEGIHTNVTQDTSILLIVKHFETGKLVNRNLSFKTVDEKDQFVNKLYKYIKYDFAYNKFKTPLIESIRTPLKMLYHTLLLFSIPLLMVYYVEVSDCSRIPVAIYPLFLYINSIGYTPVFYLIGIITLLNVLWAIRKFVTRADKLDIKRNN